MRILLVISLFVCAGCYGQFGLVGQYETEGSFVVFSFDYENSEMGDLEVDDGTYVYSGGIGLGMKGEHIINPTGVDVVEALAAENEIVYITGHGGNGSVSLPDGNISPYGFRPADGEYDYNNRLEINSRFVIIAACLAGNAEWEIVLENNSGVDGVFGYTDTTYDIEDNKVSQGFVKCLSRAANDINVNELTSSDYHNCWREANEAVGGNFNSWVSIIRDPITGETTRRPQ